MLIYLPWSCICHQIKYYRPEEEKRVYHFSDHVLLVVDDEISDSFTGSEALGFDIDVDEDNDLDEQNTEESTKFGISTSIALFFLSPTFNLVTNPYMTDDEYFH